MSRSILEVTRLQFNVGGDPIILTSSLNTLNLQGTGGKAVSLDNIENIKLIETGNGLNDIKLTAPPIVSSYTLTLPSSLGTSGQVLSLDSSGNLEWSSTGTGNVTGDVSSTDNSIVRFSGTSGKVIKGSTPQITNSGNIINVGGYFGASMILTGTANAVQHTTTGTAIMNGDDLKGIGLLELGSAKTIFISKESDLPPVVNGFHILVDNTNYIITNQISMNDGIQFGINTSLKGAGFSSRLTFPSTITAFKSIGTDVYINNIEIEGGGENSIGLCDFVDIDYTSVAPYWGRSSKCELLNNNFMNFYNLGRIDGFLTTDIVNCLISGRRDLQIPNRGFIISNCLSLEFNGNKVAFFREISVPIDTSLLTIANNDTYNQSGSNIGFNIVNINNNIINPNGQKIGINVEPRSTTVSGTISGNTFFNSSIGPLINYTNQSNFDNYNPTEIKNYMVNANNGVVNSTAVAKIDFNNNTQVTTINSVNTYVDISPPTSTIGAIRLNTHIGIQLIMTNTVPFVIDEIITGSISGTQARVVDVVNANEYYIIDTTGNFSNSENLIGSLSGFGSITSGLNGVKLKIKYLNNNPRKLNLTFSAQFSQTSGTGIGWEVAFLQNGVLDDCTGTIEVQRFNRPGTLNTICLHNFKKGDTVSWQIRNLDNSQNCLIRRASLIVGPS